MVRGDQGRATFKNDHDRQCFVGTLGEDCDKTG
jgi:hypothetical protein